MCWLHSYAITFKKKQNLIQNSIAVKKLCSPKNAVMKSDVNPRWLPRNEANCNNFENDNSGEFGAES